jgi:hypothetical protein
MSNNQKSTVGQNFKDWVKGRYLYYAYRIRTRKGERHEANGLGLPERSRFVSYPGGRFYTNIISATAPGIEKAGVDVAEMFFG